MGGIDVENLTESQAARRHRVLVSALELGAEGGYDAVQMRDVAARAGVALGTVYRYFTSKDHLLAAANVEWVEDLERRVLERPPRGSTTDERVLDVLGRALRALEQQPKLAAAVMSAQTSGDAEAGHLQATVTEVMNRIMAAAFPDDADPAEVADKSRMLGHIWFSCLAAWTSGIQGIDWVRAELKVATHHLS